MTRTSTVCLERRADHAEIVFNRPEMLNAANWQWVEDLHDVLSELEAAQDLRAVVVSGKGSSFSTGIDLKSLSAGELQIDWFRRFDEAMRRMELLNVLTIAKIRGYAIGGGLQVALACDLRIATSNARLGLPAVLEALIPGMGTYRLPRFIGLGRARRMVLTGELISAEEALQIGLVDWVVPDDKLEETTENVMAELLKGSAVAQSFSKKLVTASFESSFEEAFSAYLECQQRALESEEHRKAMQDYGARRK